MPPEFVGSQACEECHGEQFDAHRDSGHPYKLTKVENGVRPDDPPHGGFPDNPPDGWDWDDVTYIIGGYGWKARFVDTEGYVVTGAAVQYNLATEEWVGYHADEDPGTKPYNCGPCHTTGYDPEGHQDDLEGIVGTWTEPGIHCEECHGPGSSHVDAPRRVPMLVDRSAEACGDCHIRGAENQIPAKGGFIRHHEQWNEMFTSKKMSMDCVDCHDPHRSSRYSDDELNPDKGIVAQCQSCHFKEAGTQKSNVMAGLVDCKDCHMPYATKSAIGDAAAFTGDVRTHLFAINPDPEVGQYSDDGGKSLPWVSIDFACRSCHRAGGSANVHDDDALGAMAMDYHSTVE